MTNRLREGPFLLLLMATLISLLPALSLAQEQTKIRTTPVRGDLPFEGAALYKELCAACHGVDGRGDGPAATALTMQPANLTQLARKEGGKFPAAAVSRFIEGRDVLPAHGSREMPIWGQVFQGGVGDEQGKMRLRVSNLTKYIESIQVK